MGLDFGKTAQQTTTAVPEEKNEIEVVKEYDIVADRQQMNADLVNSKEVDDLVSTIEVHNLETIVSFGAEAAEEISKASDIVLNSMNMSQLDDSSEMLNTLAKIMSKFDIEEIKDNPGLFGKLFGNMRKQLDKILDKYHTMGDEVDKIYVQLKQYESEIKQSNRKLNQPFFSFQLCFSSLFSLKNLPVDISIISGSPCAAFALAFATAPFNFFVYTDPEYSLGKSDPIYITSPVEATL